MLKRPAKYTVFSALMLIPALQVNASEMAGKTIITKGRVLAVANAEPVRELSRRSPIFDVDTVSTQADSKAQFRMNDGTLLALKASSKVLISEYRYQPGQTENSAVIELVEGGLRSITGAIKANNGKYKVQTPVGSIGIRGTHFEIELVEGNLFLAVWDGAIDVTLADGSNQVSLGEGEDFSFGVINQAGDVQTLLEAPENFSSGHSSDQTDEDNGENTGANSTAATGNPAANHNDGTGNIADSSANNDGTLVNQTPNALPPQGPDTNSPNTGNTETGFLLTNNEDDVIQQLVEETVAQNDLTPPDIIANRTGEFTYSTLVSSELNASAGGATGLQVSMTVDFDNGFVPEGSLSFTDNNGEWFAAFNGVIDLNEILLGVNFATHGNELATGDISALFSNNGDRVSGQFNLFEINNPGANANGRFQIE